MRRRGHLTAPLIERRLRPALGAAMVVVAGALAATCGGGDRDRDLSPPGATAVAQAATPRPAGGADAAVPAATPVAHPPIVLMIFDELPMASLLGEGGHGVDRRRYPGFARLAVRSTLFRNATTVADGTFVGVPPILNGRIPRADLKGRSSRRFNVFTLLDPRYAIRSYEPITRVCPPRICGASRRLLAIDPAAAGRDLPALRLREARKLIDAIGRGSRPSATIVHVVLPHVPWRFFPDGREYEVAGSQIPGLGARQVWSANPQPARLGLQRHLLQLAYADRFVARAIDRLRRRGLWDRALVVVTADHGASFTPGVPRRAVTRANFAQVANVPIFVKLPGQRRGAVSDAPAQTVDILPTIAAVTGLGGGWKLQGHSLTEPHPAVTPQVRNGRRAAIVRMGLARFTRERDAWVRRLQGLYPPGRGALYRAGPNRGLVGRREARIGHVSAAGRSATIAGAGALVAGRTAAGRLPAYVSGTLSGVRSGRPLAISVNGRVAAVGASFVQGGLVSYAMIVPPGSVSHAGNRVSVFEVVGRSRLRRLASAG